MIARAQRLPGPLATSSVQSGPPHCSDSNSYESQPAAAVLRRRLSSPMSRLAGARLSAARPCQALPGSPPPHPIRPSVHLQARTRPGPPPAPQYVTPATRLTCSLIDTPTCPGSKAGQPCQAAARAGPAVHACHSLPAARPQHRTRRAAAEPPFWSTCALRFSLACRRPARAAAAASLAPLAFFAPPLPPPIATARTEYAFTPCVATPFFPFAVRVPYAPPNKRPPCSAED